MIEQPGATRTAAVQRRVPTGSVSLDETVETAADLHHVPKRTYRT